MKINIMVETRHPRELKIECLSIGIRVKADTLKCWNRMSQHKNINIVIRA